MKVILLGLGSSLAIETTQLITHLGWFDTSDLMHNTLGTVLGYGLYKAFRPNSPVMGREN